MIAAPMSWYSGYAYKDLDKGLIVEFGSAYCAQGMNAVDWHLQTSVDIKTVGIIVRCDYGGDWAKGVVAAAEAMVLQSHGVIYLQLLNST